MTKYFIDTNIIVGYILEYDDLHEDAIKVFDKYDLENQDCYISNHVLDEIITIIGQYEGPNLAYKTYLMIKDNFTILNEYHIPNFNSQVMNIYKTENKNSKQKIGFTDASIIKLIKYYEIDTLITFDKQLSEKCPIDVINKG